MHLLWPILLWLTAAFWLLRIALSAAQRALLPRLPAVEVEPSRWPSLTVVIPMRDEARNARPCLECILRQNYPGLEVIVVDDDSGDETPVILKEMASSDHRLRVLQAPPLPAGWLGKPHACHTGAGEASGERVLFLDADVRVKPGALRRAVQAQTEAQAGLWTAVPEMICLGFWERAVQPVILSWLGGMVLGQANDPERAQAIAAGPFLLFQQGAYRAVGGFQAVREELLEDLALARRAKAVGVGFRIAFAPELYGLRMYAGFHEIWRGWTKTFSGEVRGRWGVALLLAGLLVLTSLLPLLILVVSLWSLISQAVAGLLLPACVAVGGMLTFRALSNRSLGYPATWAWTHPLAKALLAIMILRAAGGPRPRWKGRSTLAGQPGVDQG